MADFVTGDPNDEFTLTGIAGLGSVWFENGFIQHEAS